MNKPGSKNKIDVTGKNAVKKTQKKKINPLTTAANKYSIKTVIKSTTSPKKNSTQKKSPKTVNSKSNSVPKTVNPKSKSVPKTFNSKSNSKPISSQKFLIPTNEDVQWRVNTNFELIAANKPFLDSIYHLTGVKLKKNQSVLLDIFGEQVKNIWQQRYSKVLNGENLVFQENFGNIVGVDDIFGIVTMNPLLNEKSEIIGVSCISKDITKIIRDIRDTQSTKIFLEKIMSSTNDMICIGNKDGIIVSISSACEKILGYKPEEIIGKNYINFVYKEDLESTFNVAASIISGNSITNFENRYVRKDGSIVPLIWSVNWVEEDGLLYSVAHDATDIKKFQDELKISEEKFRNLFNLNPLPTWIFDTENFRIYDVNQTALDFYGYTRSEFLNLNIFDLRPQEEIPRVKNAIENYINAKGIIRFGTFIHKKKNGQLVYMNISGQNTDYLGKKCMMVSSLDVTEHENLVKKLIDSEKKFNDAAKIAKLGYWNLYLDKNTLEWSEEVYNIWGVDKNNFQVSYESFIKTMHPDDYEIFSVAQAKAFSGDGELDFVHRIILPDGNIKWVHELGKIVYDHLGKPLSLKGTVQDITLQKIEEQSIKLMNKVITNTSDSVMIMEAIPLDEPGPRIIYINHAFTKLTGYSENEIIGKTPRVLNGPETDTNTLREIRASMEKSEPVNFTLLCYKKSGETYWANRVITPVDDEHGNISHWISVERDVTKQKLIEIEKSMFADLSKIFNRNKTLISSLDETLKFLLTFGNFKIAEIWMLAPDNKAINLISVSPKPGVDNKFAELSKNINSFVYGDGIPGFVWKNLKTHVFNTSESHQVFKRKNYAEQTGIHSLIGIPLISNNEFIGCLLLGSEKENKFLTDYKNIFENLKNFLGSEVKRKQLEDELNKLFDTAPEIICIAGFDGYFKKINASATQILGYSNHELISQPFANFIHPEDQLKTDAEYSNLIDGKPTIQFENRYISKEGKIVWLSWTVTPVVEEKLMYGIAKDITEHRKIKNLLDDASELAKIGSWEIDLISGKIFSSAYMKRLYEVPDDYQLKIEEGMTFHKEGFYRENIKQKFQEAVAFGNLIDTESIVITKKGKEIWVRIFAKPEFLGGKCVRVFGCTQDITAIKNAELNLEKSFKEKFEILESIGDGFFAVDKNFVVTYWNKKAEELLFKTKEEMLGKNLWEVFPEAKNLDSYVKYNHALVSGEAVYFEDFYPPINRWYEVSAYPSESGLSVYFKDISDKKIVEKKLIESNERFEKVTLATQDAIWDWDLINNTIHWGGGFNNLFGYEVNDSDLGIEVWTDHIHPDDMHRVTESIFSAIENPSVSNWTSEYRFLKANGQVAHILDKGFIMRDIKGKGFRMVGAMTDITQRKEYEESLKHLTENLTLKTNELTRSNKELEQFAYITSHDLQEPLRMITGFLSQLQRKYGTSLDEKAHQYIHFAVDGATRMRQIILDLLEFSRANRFNDIKTEINLNELIDEICILQRKLIEEKSATITKENLPVINFYKSPLMQIFHNIINNSLKYSKENIPADIIISAEEFDNHWQFKIKDNGIGIEEEYFEKIFLIFQRLHGKEKYSGTGMGLAIVKKIIETYGGKIWVNSTPGIGTEIIFTFNK